jgi:hypothetical protein
MDPWSKETVKGVFNIFKTPNCNKISMTVALPAFNAKKIIWLALESLKNQKINNDIYWELIICEEYGESRDEVKKYINDLQKVNCAKLTYIYIDPKTEGVIPKIYLLLEKWTRMAKLAEATSKVYIMMACDIYAHPHRLMIHHEHFKNEDCIISTQPIGPFYNILKTKIFIYDGTVLNNKTKSRHLNMGFKLEYMKRIKIINKRKSIDSYIQNSIIQMLKKQFSYDKNIFYDLSDNWKYGFDTDGYNNISKYRRTLYNIDEEKIDKVINKLKQKNRPSLKVMKKITPIFWCLPLYKSVEDMYGYNGLEEYIPANIIKKLEELRKC